MSAAEHQRLIQGFYASFARRDGPAMGACYTADATFEDPVFTLAGPEIGAMWTMLCERGSDLRIEATGVEADERAGKAHWEAWYTFSASGRKVHNIIEARFTFRDGKIASHRDSFDMWRWSRQALGAKGLFLGNTRLLRNAVRAQAKRRLDAWMQRPGTR